MRSPKTRALAARADRMGVFMLGTGAKSRTLKAPESHERPKKVSVAVSAYLGLTERQFQRVVRSFLEHLGYVVHVFPTMKMTVAGWPDLSFWHPDAPGRLWLWELKTERGRIRPEQRLLVAHMATVPGIDARIVRPAEWPALRDELIVLAPAVDGE